MTAKNYANIGFWDKKRSLGSKSCKDKSRTLMKNRSIITCMKCMQNNKIRKKLGEKEKEQAKRRKKGMKTFRSLGKKSRVIYVFNT